MVLQNISKYNIDSTIISSLKEKVLILEFNNILLVLSLWDEQKGPTVYDCNQAITQNVNAISIQCFMPCFHLFSSGLAEQSKKPPMKLTLPLPNYEKFARIYFGCWEDPKIRGEFRAFGIFIILSHIQSLEELFFDTIIGKLKLTEDFFKKDLKRTLVKSFNIRTRTSFDAETALNNIKARLITINHLTNIYKTQELKLIAKKLGITAIPRRSKKKLATDILISLLDIDID
ncbi:MAG: hypothetical protein ACXADY_11820 [Candidatus Hodarchaeales archaeon]|jgi:hypothetical protein